MRVSKRLWRAVHGLVWRRPLTGFVIRVWRERLTQSGRFVVIGAMASGIATGFPNEMAGTVAFSLFSGLLLTSWVTSLFLRPRVTVERAMADRCMAGQTIPLTIRVRNDSSKTLLDIGAYEFRLPRRLKLTEESRYINRLAPHQSHEFEYPLQTRRRGSYMLHGPTALSAFPFALTHARRYSPSTHRLTVYPRFTPIHHLHVNTGQRYQPGGVALLSKIGESMEYIGNREYRIGDRMRDLHRRSWARVGRPIVRQYQQEYLTRVAMVVDTYVPVYYAPRFRTSGNGWRRMWKAQMLIGPDRDLFETQLSLAAAIADYLARQDYLIDLLGAGPQLYRFQAGRSLAYLDNVLDILACLDRCTTDSLERIAPVFCEQLNQTSTVILMLVRWDKTRAELLNTLRLHGAEIRAILLSDDPLQAAEARKAGVTTLTVPQVQAGVEEL